MRRFHYAFVLLVLAASTVSAQLSLTETDKAAGLQIMEVQGGQVLVPGFRAKAQLLDGSIAPNGAKVLLLPASHGSGNPFIIHATSLKHTRENNWQLTRANGKTHRLSFQPASEQWRAMWSLYTDQKLVKVVHGSLLFWELGFYKKLSKTTFQGSEVQGSVSAEGFFRLCERSSRTRLFYDPASGYTTNHWQGASYAPEKMRTARAIDYSGESPKLALYIQKLVDKKWVGYKVIPHPQGGPDDNMRLVKQELPPHVDDQGRITRLTIKMEALGFYLGLAKEGRVRLINRDTAEVYGKVVKDGDVSLILPQMPYQVDQANSTITFKPVVIHLSSHPKMRMVQNIIIKGKLSGFMVGFNDPAREGYDAYFFRWIQAGGPPPDWPKYRAATKVELWLAKYKAGENPTLVKQLNSFVWNPELKPLVSFCRVETRYPTAFGHIPCGMLIYRTGRGSPDEMRHIYLAMRVHYPGKENGLIWLKHRHTAEKKSTRMGESLILPFASTLKLHGWKGAGPPRHVLHEGKFRSVSVDVGDHTWKLVPNPKGGRWNWWPTTITGRAR